jgi:hypothetical protein
VLIGEVRRACGDEARAPLFIKTAHGVGYSFCGEATEVDGPPPRSSGGVRCWLAWRQQTFPLSPGDNVIGRDPRCNVWLDHDGVSAVTRRFTSPAMRVRLSKILRVRTARSSTANGLSPSRHSRTGM